MAAVNPNPGTITAAVWSMWTTAAAVLPGVRLGGIYAAKSGYHNTRANNQRSWPGNYSIRVALDLQGPSNRAAAIDYTLSTAEMRKRTGYLNAAAAAGDPRLAAVREYYGTLNGSTVHGRIKDSRAGAWRSSSADSTHLWHIHLSFFRAYVDAWAELAPVMSVLAGQSLAQWRTNPILPSGQKGAIMFPSKGDSIPAVEYWQRMLIASGEKLPKFGADSHFGDETVAAVQSSRAKLGWDPVASPRITAAHAVALQRAVFGSGSSGGATESQVRAAVETYLTANPPKPGQDGRTPTKVTIELTGDVTAYEAS